MSKQGAGTNWLLYQRSRRIATVNNWYLSNRNSSRLWHIKLVAVVVVVIVARQAVRPTSSNQLLGQTFRPISSNQLLANYFSIHSQHSKKEGRQGRIE